MTIREAAAKLRRRELSSVELTNEALKKIRERQAELNAFITITDELAETQARRADDELARGMDRGPLHGIPYALKDVFNTAGIRTTVGSKIYFDHVPDHNSAVYERLRDAGAVLTGKTGLQEFAYGITCNNPHFGAIRNPHDPTRIPGGSSGGSGVAVASGMVFFAMGSDTGGSIRIPASFCGCVGLKPTSGRVSRFGVMPLDFSLDHMGPLTRTADDAALVMNAIAGFDPRDDTSSRHAVPDFARGNSTLKELRVGIPENFYFDRVDPQIAAAFQSFTKRVESAGARLIPVQVPDPVEINVISRVILLSEASALLEPHLHRRNDFGTDVIALLDQGRLISATDYINAQRLRRLYQKQWAGVFQHIDCIFTPTAPIFAPVIGATHIDIQGESEDCRLASTRFVRAINVIGLPALSLPLRGTDLPAGVQMIGRPFSEPLILRSAHCAEVL